MLKQKYQTISLFVIFVLSGCTSKFSHVSPETINLSGNWELNQTYSEEVQLRSPRAQNRERPEGGRSGKGRGGGGRPQDGEGRGSNQTQERDQGNQGDRKPPEKTNAMQATQMTITQNYDSMSIAYQNGDYRDIEWGKVKRWNGTTIAGWNKKNQLIIETENEKNQFIESYELKPGGKILELIIDVNGDESGGKFRRVFMLK